MYHKCMSVLNKNTDTLAQADSYDFPVNSLREKKKTEKEVVSTKEHFWGFVKRKQTYLLIFKTFFKIIKDTI